MDEKCHREWQSVTPSDDVALAEDWAEYLVYREQKHTGLTKAAARAIVSRKTGVPEGKLYSLWRKRLKEFPRRLLVRLGENVVARLQDDLRHVEHDLQILRQIGAAPHSGEMLALLASRTRLREALGLDAPPENGGGNG